MRRPKWSPNALRAHEVTAYAKERGKDGEFHHLAAAAYWEFDADLNDLDVLKGIAEAAGLDWADLGPRIESGEYREAVLREDEVARDKGVSGTPTYMIAGELHPGDVSIDELRQAIKSAAG
jgi:predicted DsbA family dithiol-disulfide isomerase